MYNFRDPWIQEIYREAEQAVREKIAAYDRDHAAGK